MDIAERYTWEAEFQDGAILTKGGDGSLWRCVRFSLIPAEGLRLPRHDITGVKMKRRFGSRYLSAFTGGIDGSGTKEYTQCVVCKGYRFYVRCSNGSVIIVPEDFELNL